MQRRELDLPNLDEVLQDVHHLHAQGCRKAGQWDLTQACGHTVIPINRSTVLRFKPRGFYVCWARRCSKEDVSDAALYHGRPAAIMCPPGVLVPPGLGS